MTVFGSQGGAGNVLECRELSRQDKISLLRVGVGKNLLDPETEARLLASEPRLDLEMVDPLKASTITVKFVAVKTPLGGVSAFPTKVYFTFKFFTFHSVHTETVYLKDATSNQAILPSQLKIATQYLLSKTGSGALSSDALLRIFDVDPSLSQTNDETTDNDEHMHLAAYLKERVLTLDLWNGDSLMHFGTCKVPLASFMRQGQPSKVVAQEYDISDSCGGGTVGALQLLVTNEGRKVAASSAPQID